MVRPNLILSATAALALSIATAAQAAPPHQTLTPYAGEGIVVKVGNCHANYRTHYVDEIDDVARHKHRGNGCVPVIQGDGGGFNNHCHSNGQRHRHSGFGRTTHSHYGISAGWMSGTSMMATLQAATVSRLVQYSSAASSSLLMR